MPKHFFQILSFQFFILHWLLCSFVSSWNLTDSLFSPNVPLELLRSPLQRTSLYSPRAVTLPTTAYFPIFPSSCYAPHYSALPCIPFELLRSPIQLASFYIPLKSSSFYVHRDVVSDNLHYIAARFCWSLAWLFVPEDGGDMFLRNVLFSPNYTTLHPRMITELSKSSPSLQENIYYVC
jgi:hypothetical protein